LWCKLLGDVIYFIYRFRRWPASSVRRSVIITEKQKPHVINIDTDCGRYRPIPTAALLMGGERGRGVRRRSRANIMYRALCTFGAGGTGRPMFALPLRRAAVMVMYLHVRHVYSQRITMWYGGSRRRSSFTPTMIINYMTEAVVVHTRALDFGQNRKVSPRIM